MRERDTGIFESVELRVRGALLCPLRWGRTTLTLTIFLPLRVSASMASQPCMGLICLMGRCCVLQTVALPPDHSSA